MRRSLLDEEVWVFLGKVIFPEGEMAFEISEDFGILKRHIAPLTDILGEIEQHLDVAILNVLPRAMADSLLPTTRSVDAPRD